MHADARHYRQVPEPCLADFENWLITPRERVDVKPRRLGSLVEPLQADAAHADLGRFARMDLDRERYGLSSSYVWLEADTAENRATDTQELYFDGRYALTEAWTGKLSARYDFEADRATRAGVGFQFRNECLLVDLSLSRRFTSSTSVKPTTDFGLSVDLLGFGGSAPSGATRRCRSSLTAIPLPGAH